MIMMSACGDPREGRRAGSLYVEEGARESEGARMSLVADIGASLSNGLFEAVAGGVSGGLTILCVLPIESIQTFQAAGNMPGRPTMGDVARHLWTQGGPTRFFKGWIASSSTVCTEKFWLFFWYSILQAVAVNLRGLPNAAALGGVVLTLCGWAAENLSIPTRYPVEVILRDQQTSLKTEGFTAVAKRIWKTQGLGGFYKGCEDSLTLFCLHSQSASGTPSVWI